ncbi:YfhO family protein [Microbacterium sp. CFH 90308]|uniref:YfhO family protein n=1 Tax=Microbacterium salsuginis TaxID=2722803 RepID=A0ABX1KA70_9MICO|nr:YfhO family protein [Microbacterium sp. CFH 90308]NLP83912.1 YfhO family protein [Microbacterium sp. CFH 90308]
MPEGAAVWWLLACAATVLIALVRVVVTTRYFFWDDTQLGAYGQWYGLGSRLLSGSWTMLDPGAWQGGNYLAEGQWGLLSPLAWVIAVGSHAVPNAVVYATVVKVVFLLALCTGVFLLAREFGAAPHWAAVAGFIATTGGQTAYLDAPSWVTGLQNVALFALTWWAVRRHVRGGRSPIPFFILALLLITVGYVFGVIELAFLLIATVIEEWVRRGFRATVRPLVLGVYAALLTVLVYLPGVLTAPVTERANAGIANDLFLNMDIGDLATSAIPTAVSTVKGYWGDIAPVPLQYVTWLLPLFVLFARAAVKNWRSLLVPYAMLAVSVALVIGPSVIGPLRYPARMMPYVVVVVALVFAVLASRGMPPVVTFRQRVGIVLITVLSAWLAWAAQPAAWAWVGLGLTLQLILYWLLDRWYRTGGSADTGSEPDLVAGGSGAGREGGGRAGTSRAATLALLTLAASVVVLAPQLAKYPTSPLGDFRVPSSVAQLRSVGDGMDSGIMSVGDVYSLQSHPESYQESLLANLWYVTGKDSASVYTVLPFSAFVKDLCIDLRGWTCPGAYDALFGGQAPLLVDDLSLNTVIVIKGEGLEEEPVAPEGWTVEPGEFTWTLHRNDPLPPAGGVARTAGGTEVTVLSQSDTSVTFTVDAVGARGGEVVFSRLAWPGYATDRGALADPERGYLLTVEVGAADVGETVTVTFRPPGWAFELGAGIAAAVLAIGWSVASPIVLRRAERTQPASAAAA